MTGQLEDLSEPQTEQLAPTAEYQHKVPLYVSLSDLEVSDWRPGNNLALLQVEDIEDVAGDVEGDGEAAVVGAKRGEGMFLTG